MRAIFTRTSRKLSRAFDLNHAVSITSSGRIANVTRASRQFSQNKTPTMPTSSTMSPKIATSPAVNSSFNASTSVVTRVTKRPTGERSKNCTCRLCRWVKISSRRSDRMRCPIHCIRNDCAYNTTKLATIAIR